MTRPLLASEETYRGRLCRAASAFAPVLFLLVGCASYPERLHLYTCDVVIASPQQVADHYRHVNARYQKTHSGYVPTHDQGEPIPADEQIRGFTNFTTSGKPTIFLSADWRNCLQHEAAHVQYPNDPGWVERNVPCLGELPAKEIKP